MSDQKQVTRRQHFVPRFYLRGFEGPNGVYVYDKVHDRRFCTSPENIAHETWFHEVPDKFAPSPDLTLPVNTIENYLAVFEGRFAPIIQQLRVTLSLADRSFLERGRVFSPQLKVDFSDFLAVQVLRTRDHRVVMREMTRKLRSHLKKFGPIGPDLKKELEQASDPEFEPVLHMGILFDGKTRESIASTLASHIWITMFNCTEAKLWTSDNPVVKIPHVKHPVRSNSGIASPGIEIVYPLSPRVLLCMLERNYWEFLEGRDGRVLLITDRENIDYYNSLTLSNCTNQVYSYYDDLDFAQKIRHENIKFSNPPKIIIAGEEEEENPKT